MLDARLRQVARVHFVGIGGSGMAGIAEVLVNLGYTVTGSDMKESGAVERLRQMGARVYIGHDAAHVDAVDVVVRSSAVDSRNPEVAAALARRVPVIRRAEMLAELMRFRFGIAIAGTHGKTTTTSLTATVLAAGQLDPTYVIGGRLKSSGANAALGTGPYLVAEADESDASFLHLTPMISVVTNVDMDHMETYGHDPEQLYASYIQFLHQLPFYGLALLCADDAELMKRCADVGRPFATYGFAAQADYRASNLRADGACSVFDFTAPGQAPVPVRLALPGRHNVQNATAALAVATELGLAPADIADSLATFKGVGRRCEVLGELPLPQGGQALVIDDYGHHPRELEATLAAVAEAWPERRCVLIFQPHRYSRTRDLFEDFARVLSTAPALLLTEVYPAGEKPIAQADGRSLTRAIRLRGAVEPVFVDTLDTLPAQLARIAMPGDLLLFMGAGDISQQAQQLMATGLAPAGAGA
ncbi:MAG: UDP-N-acetylmuramate--L-alanine ligase [Oceanococcaceae bacterium]